MPESTTRGRQRRHGLAICLVLIGIGVASTAIILGVPPSFNVPILEFPIQDVAKVSYLRAYGIPGWSGPGTHHDGIDLAINGSVAIISPVDGTVVAITSHQNPHSTIQNVLFEITILVNWGWSVSLVLEPMFNGNDTANNNLQQASITATILQRVHVGQQVATLLYAGSGAYSHLHYKLNSVAGDTCPYACSSATARAAFDVIAARSTDDPCVPA